MDPNVIDRIMAKGDYSLVKSTVTLKYPTGIITPFALKLNQHGVHPVYWDMNAFRPDPRRIEGFIKLASSNKGCVVSVLYENVIVNNELVEVPRYIVWKKGKECFVNVR